MTFPAFNRCMIDMKYLLLLVFIANGLAVSAQDKEKSWYKMLAGTIGKYPVTMHLHKAGHSYTGYYSYNSQRLPVALSGNDTTEKGRITLLAFAGDESNEIFSITIINGKAAGSWKKKEGTEALKFTAGEKKMPVQFTHIYTSAEKQLRPAMKESPVASIELSSIWPLGNSEADELVKEQVRAVFVEQKNKEDIGKIFLRVRDEFFRTYQEDNKEASDSELVEYSHAYQYSFNQNLEIRDYHKDLLNLCASYYSYSGGAHGMYASSYYVLDLQKKKRVMLNDLFDEKGMKALDKLLEKHYRSKYEVAPNETLEEGGLFENSIAATENFYITGKGIGFVYHPYEIASYAMGEIEIFIPLKEILPHLKPGAKAYW